MLFHSIDFAIFLPIVFILYWFVVKNRIKGQNIVILVASYVFYGWWDWRFLVLILFSSLVDFLAGISISSTTAPKIHKLWLILSICVNLGLLGVFKYYDFFLESFTELFTFFGGKIEVARLDVILPVGISFYTFQSMSYTIDVYRKKIIASRDLLSFLAFVSFFPQLVAGPIERAINLLPQLTKARTFEYKKAADGMRQILWGLFKKIVIADSCAFYVDLIYLDSVNFSGSTLMFGTFLFAVQIYCDFSGYSDMAIGTARLFGINLKQNFAFPLFSQNINEFWKRWHISLMTWLRDYVYKPLMELRPRNKRTKAYSYQNVLIIFFVCGLWHGPNWTYVLWGSLNGIYFIIHAVVIKNIKMPELLKTNTFFPSQLKTLVNIITTLFFICIAGVFFRAESAIKAFEYIGGIFSWSLFQLPDILPKQIFFLLLINFGIEWIQRKKLHGLEFLNHEVSKPVRWGIYISIFLLIAAFGKFSGTEYVYFAF